MSLPMHDARMNPNSILYDKVLGCLAGGVIGDAMGTPTEKLTHQQIHEKFGWVDSFSGEGTDDSLLKHILCETLERSGGHASADLWAEDWLRHENTFIDSKLFFVPVLATFWKLRAELVPPREAGLGNMASSSSAMCISPMGIVNAGNPRQAVMETFEIAGLIHHNFCRDGACAMAAAVAEAFRPRATVDSVIDAAGRYLPRQSARPMIDALDRTFELAREAGSYEEFRDRYVRDAVDPRRHFTDSRETVPLGLALVLLARGDPKRTIEYGANFGRDADTIASMAGAVAGALSGASALPPAWMQAMGKQAERQRDLAGRMVRLAVARADEAHRLAQALLESAA